LSPLEDELDSLDGGTIKLSNFSSCSFVHLKDFDLVCMGSQGSCFTNLWLLRFLEKSLGCCCWLLFVPLLAARKQLPQDVQ
jgi:hypothetical protein